MRINLPTGHITIADDSEIAQKIKQGYDFSITSKGNIKIGKMGTEIKNKWQVIKAIKSATTIEELETILIKFIELCQT